MTEKNNNIIQAGNDFMFPGTSVKVLQKLPVETYHVTFNPMSGFGLEKLESNFTVPENTKVFGGRDVKVKMVEDVYRESPKSIGVMLTGNKGIGKTLFACMVSAKMQEAFSMPTIIVDSTSGARHSAQLAEYIDTLPSNLLIMFDEFEKMVDKEEQQGFLGLFDGMSTNKRLYMITANNDNGVNQYFKGRPGRFFFDFKFSYLNPSEVVEYVKYYYPELEKSEEEYLSELARMFDINYDKLNALTTLRKVGYSFYEGVQNLNLELIQSGWGGNYQDAIINMVVKNKKTGEVVYEDTFEKGVNLLGITTGKETIRYDLRNSDNFSRYSDVTAEGFIKKQDGSYVSVNAKVDLTHDDDEPEYDKYVKTKITLEASIHITPKPKTIGNADLNALGKTYGYGVAETL